MRVLLIQPPIEDFYTTPIRLYPLGLLYAARVLDDAGAEVGILDCLKPLWKRKIPIPASFGYLPPLDEIPYFFKGYYRFGLDAEQIIARVKEFSPDLVGISSQFTAYYKSVEELSRLIKREFRIPVFIGGNHATVFAAEIRRRTPEIDFVLEGPAEECLPPFLTQIGLKSRAYKQVARAERDQTDHTERPHRRQTLKESMPTERELSQTVPVKRPDWRKIQPSHHLLRGEEYRVGRKNCISLSASRGCPYGCDFCSVRRMFGRDIRYREIDAVLAEMRWNYARKETRLFNFEDDNLSYNRSWFLEFLNAVASDRDMKDIELAAMNGLCANTLDGEVLTAMRRSGFREINLSLVTRSEELQRRHRRPYLSDRADRFDNLIKTARELSFFITVYVILGLPGQSYVEVKESVDHLLDLGVLVGPSVFYLAPGSRLYEEMNVPLDLKDDWNLYRSSAFAVETSGLNRRRLFELFSYVRRKNLERKGVR
jgi:radical SAM superfamily enzyme YgiQ (UPF0313 family)